MKINIQVLLMSLLATFTVNRTAAQTKPSDGPRTNSFSITEFSGDGVEQEVLYYRSRVVTGRPTPEILPAMEDTKGNWGQPTEGLQLSARFRRNEFLTNEPVNVMVIIRNINSTPREIRLPEQPFEYTLHSGTETIEWKPKKVAFTGGSNPGNFLTIPVKGEVLALARLDQIFDLKRLGDYSIQVKFPTAISGRNGITNIASGIATFKTVEELSPSVIGETNAIFQTTEEGKKRFYETLRHVDQTGKPISNPK